MWNLSNRVLDCRWPKPLTHVGKLPFKHNAKFERVTKSPQPNNHGPSRLVYLINLPPRFPEDPKLIRNVAIRNALQCSPEGRW
jgi:hypothetical protein